MFNKLSQMKTLLNTLHLHGHTRVSLTDLKTLETTCTT